MAADHWQPDPDEGFDSLVKRLVVCVIGHVTDPYVDLDTRTGRPAAEQLSPSTALGKSAYYQRAFLEKGDARWKVQCRHVFQTGVNDRGGEGRPHQCGRSIHGVLCEHEALEAAYRVGGPAAAVRQVFEARHGRR